MTNYFNAYELKPNDGHKSFYGKAIVLVEPEKQTLLSYGTPIIQRNADGTYKRLWYGWSATTQRHIKAFCGMNKAQFDSL